MSARRSSRVIQPPLRFRDQSETDGATCEESGLCPERGSGGEEEVTRGQGSGDAGGSGAARDRSRSPHRQSWKTDAEPDDGVPQPPRFNPKRTPGVQPPLNIGNPPPGEIFSHFFDASVYKLLCENTNKNAAINLEKGKKFLWTKIKAEEMKRFIGMLLYMSVLDLPRISDFWRRQTIFKVPLKMQTLPQEHCLEV